MARPLNELGALGERVAETLAQDSARRERAIEVARRALASGRPRRGRAFALMLAGAAGLVCAAALVFFLVLPKPLQFRIDGASGAAQTWLAAPSTRASQLTFSDGSVVDAEPASRLRVVETNTDGAEILLESGALRAHITHTDRSRWGVTAGPFAVRVTGTRFTLDWKPTSQVFSLAVSEGSVIVSGSVVGEAWPLRAGDKLVASVAEGRVEVMNPERAERAAAQAPADPKPAPTSLAAPSPSSAPHVALPASEASAREKPEADWRAAAKSGDLKQAYAMADQSGFARVCGSASAAELLLLGDAARLSGRADRAREALLTLRQRYPRDSRRAAAAFALGKAAFDGRGAYREAAEWFATSIREAPGGPLAREAAGRRLEALRHTGDPAGVQAAATDYLARYPDGPHAALARSILR